MPLPLFLAPAASFLLKPLVPWVIAGAAILGCVVLYALWGAAEKGEAAAELKSALHEADAVRWEQASGLRDQAIEQLKSAYALQTEKVQEGRAKEQALNAAIRETAKRNIALQATNDQLERELDAEAEKAPGDVVKLGPIVLRRAGGLFE
jgi:hypothetical protein